MTENLGDMTRTAIVLAVLVAFGACSDGASRIASSPTPDTARRDEPTEWFLRSVSGDGKTIAFVYRMSGVASDCEHEGRATVDESDDRVMIIAHKSVTLDRDRACTEELAYVDESVQLADPSGERSLVGCRPGHAEPSEDETCRDLGRSRDAGVFEFSPRPTP
jgi:hypothetical protein